MAETFYSVLGVDPEADTETIQAAYRELVKTHHPDVSDEDDAARQFKRITQARDILCDESSRKQYDRVGHNTYVRRYMDSSAWTAEYGSSTGPTGSARSGQSGRSSSTGPGDRGRTTDRSRAGRDRRRRGQRTTDSWTGGDTDRSEDAGDSETAHDYDRYRSEYSATATHGSGAYTDDWEERTWTEDVDWDPGESTATDHTDPGTQGAARTDGWQRAEATATGYRPSGHDVSGPATTSGSRTGRIKLALRDIGPWLVFHLVFLISAFVTILLLMSWEASVPTVLVSLLVLGGAVFFSVLHMVSRIYS